MTACHLCGRKPMLPGDTLCQECILAVEWWRNLALQDRAEAVLKAQGKPDPARDWGQDAWYGGGA